MKNLVLILGVLIVIVFTSCDFNTSGEDDFVKIMMEQVVLEYESLSSLEKLETGKIDSVTNFNQVGNTILYKGTSVIKDATPLYGKENMLLVFYRGQPTVVYKNMVEDGIMKYNYTIVGVKAKDNVLIIKGYKIDHDIYMKYVLYEDKPMHLYTYGY